MDRHAWLPDVERHLGSYVYLLVDPRDSRIFYVGKGVGSRCFAHVAEARKTQADSKGDYTKLRLIREIEGSGADVRIEILRHGLTSDEAFILESAVIDLLGAEALDNRVRGQHSRDVGRTSVDDINVRYGAKPVVIDPADRVMLIRARKEFREGMSEPELLKAVSEWWRSAPMRRIEGGPRAPEYAMAVQEGAVRAVFRITGWRYPAPEVLAVNPSADGRWAFSGVRDAAAEEKYLLRDVTAYLKPSARNPIVYVNC